ncbi:ATP-dependent nuclease [Roseibium litorale]|uniref:ATP-binding protein n=1 Tax=Roseibium litorale TaxID=2803841 RepID=A0ABR9CTP4_9HYPH|nr:AAA family ATPase [Roseibium litorale]MBD8893964.1 ATP-binding protein [Roseibium litorale]
MISSILFKFGSSINQPKLKIQMRPSITIFVGPNNSGKSQSLREINDIFKNGSNPAGKVISEIEFQSYTKEFSQNILTSHLVPAKPGEGLNHDQAFVQFDSNRIIVNKNIFTASLINPNNIEQNFRHHFVNFYAKHYILSLDGPSRINLLNSQERGDLKNPSGIFSRLLVSDERRETLRKLVFEATGLYFCLDISEGSKISVRFGEERPPNERSLEDKTLDYMRTAFGANAVSDGIKAFTGILTQLHVGQPKVITIDEPEAFLHPNLAFKLGKELAKGAIEERKHIFVSTHSAQFLMGAFSSGAEVNIIRLTHQNGIGTARLLSGSQLISLMNDPLLRSVGVMEGLFYDSVIVGEANADRAFYQEVNERLLAIGDERGAPRTLFLNADNKQTIPKILEPLRKLGIPAAGIVDIDIVKEGGKVWAAQLTASNIPKLEHQSYADRRKNVLVALEATGKDFKMDGGIDLLSSEQREITENLINDLASYGLFVVPHGEVEHWLSDLNVDRSKNSWLRSIFEKMGSDPSSDGYIQPTEGDVWDFIGKVSAWMKDSKRKGIPA